MATTAEGWLRRRLLEPSELPRSAACDAVGWMLREVSLHHRASALPQDGLQLALCVPGGLLCCPGTATTATEAVELCERDLQVQGTLDTTGMELLSSFGEAMWMAGDREGALRALQQAAFFRRANRNMENPQGAALLRNLGVMRWAMGSQKESLEHLEEVDAAKILLALGAFSMFLAISS